MTEPFVGEIKMFAGNFAPRGWAQCDGQLLAVSQNDALFSLLGTIYGGDGRTTFGLPELRGRVPMHKGSGPGLTPRNIGASFGVETVTLTAQETPNHTHTVRASTDQATATSPTNNALAEVTSPAAFKLYSTDVSNRVNLASTSVGNTGGQAHNNMMPFQTINFIIALVGIYPSRS